MLWYMAGVNLALTVVREGRLRWFAHIKRWEGEGLLRKVMVIGVPGVRPKGRPRKQ